MNLNLEGYIRSMQ